MRMLLLLAALAAAPVAAQPIDSDLADARAGGGCYPTGFTPSILDMLVLINPEWAPIVNPQSIDSPPVAISGAVGEMHGQTSGDFPSTHLFSDVVMDVHVDPEHADKVATGNGGPDVIAFEWEVGSYPDWAWPGFGDRIYGLGRHIFDCGHPDARPGQCSVTTSRQCVLDTDCHPPNCSACQASETCGGEHFGYSSEMHPPHATAVIRQGRGAALSKRPNANVVPATIADVWVSADGGGAGDRCVITHQPSEANQLTIECWPLKEPVAMINATDFTFTVPLPAKPADAGKPRWRILAPPADSTDATAVNGGRPARFKVKKQLGGPTPSLQVTVKMTKKVKGGLPTGFAGRIVAGWNDKSADLTHVRVNVSAILVDNDLMRATPIVPRTCSTSNTACNVDGDCPQGESCFGAGPVNGWAGQAAANGEWRRFAEAPLVNVHDGDVVAQSISWDQYLPADGALRIQADAYQRDCIDTAYGHSLADGLKRLGLNKGIVCLGGGTAHAAGGIDVTYSGPDFGAGTYETQSTGGEGGRCSITTTTLCVVDADCPNGETCATTGGAFRLRYTIEKVS